ncbi:DUF4359 domain-containing protein [Geminocystis sp.]|uniref:DUF4359 domain-containing protein n=1 Tax=Geminocystis sp. TaxID=2664100 RepID=UPI003592F195
MKFLEKKDWIFSIITFILVTTTPNESQYIDYLKTEMSKGAEENICNYEKTFENSLSNMFCNFLSKDIVISMGYEMIRHSVITKNYLIFSDYTIIFDNSKTILIGL